MAKETAMIKTFEPGTHVVQRGRVALWDGQSLHYLWGRVGGGSVPEQLARHATPEEVQAYEDEIAEREEKRRAQHEKEAKLLAKYGLQHSDFVRFRTCHERDGRLHVSTRENGAFERSIKAIKKGNVLSARPDEGDPTYEDYVFGPPAEAP